METKSSTAISIDNLSYLPQFAAWLLSQKLDEFVQKQIDYGFQLNIPLLKFFLSMPEKERFEIGRQTTTQFLQYLADNKAAEHINRSMEQWKTNQLPVIDKDAIIVDDITLVNYMRKKAMTEFLPAYTTNPHKIIELVNEIDLFITFSITTATNQYISLFRESLEDHSLFIQKVAETIPGAVYVFDVTLHKGIYSNKKLADIIGYDQAHLNSLGKEVIRSLIHPDDQTQLQKNLTEIRTSADDKVRMVKYRIRKPDGTYKWLANYESVFKRMENGEVWQTIGITLDVDQEQKLLDELEKADKRHKQAEALTHIGTYSWNYIKDEINWSDEMYRIYEEESNKAINYSYVLERIIPEDKQTIDTLIKDCIEKQGSYDFYYRIIGKNGKIKILHSRGHVELNNEGVPERIVGTDQDVTEKQTLIRSLRKSESLYRQAEEIASMGNWSWDVKADQLEWTDQLYHIYGLEPQSENITIDRFLSFIHPEDREYVEQGIDELNREQSLDYTFRIITEDGAQKWLRSIAQVVRDENEKVIFIVGTEQDVTEKQKLIGKLEESQRLYKEAQRLARLGNFTWNLKTGEVFWSDEVYSIYEKPYGETVHFEDAFNPIIEEHKAMVQNAIEDTIATKNGKSISYAIRKKDGGLKYVNLHTDVSLDNNGEVFLIIGTAQDVTEQREAIETIREQEYFIQQVADASPTILYLFDVSTQSIAYINREAFFVLGYLPDEIMEQGSNITSVLYHPEDIELLPSRKQSKKKFQQVDAMIQYECRMRHKNGDYCWVLVREIVFKTNESGEITQIIGAALDISKRKEMERTILQNTHQLEQSNASLEEFAYVASHDLKEPLRKISTFGDRLVASHLDKLNDEGKIYLRKIVDASQRMQNMISDLLSIALITGNRSFEPVSLQKILEETLQTLEFKIEQQKAIIKYKNLPEVNVVPSQFRQLFQNLIANSLKFVRKDVQPVITIECTQPSEEEVERYALSKSSSYIKLVFTDNGIGFEKEYEQRIFAIFQRLHGRSEYEGSGIGLAICKKIVEHHGGIIYATAIAGEGAIFTIIIPA